LSFYKLNRIYTGQGEGDFFDVLPKDLKFQRVGWYNHSKPKNPNMMFKGIKIKPYDEPEISKELKKIKPVYDKSWKQKVYNKLKEIVFNHWDSNRFHVVAHSGGVDSRILSTIIKELTEQHGREWLGDVLFVENGGECETFKQIMKTQKWDKKQYLSYQEGIDPREYHRRGLDFKNLYKKYNGPVSYPFRVLLLLGVT
jgi:hypothetical protein